MQYEQSVADEAEESGFKRLSAEDVKMLRRSSPPSSPWLVIFLQVLVGVILVGVAGVVTGSRPMVISVAYGVLAVVVPAMVFVRGLVRQQGAPSAGSALGGFFCGKR